MNKPYFSHKKFIILFFIIAILSLIVSPDINAQITKKDVNAIVNSFMGRTSVKTGCEDDYSIYDLLIITPSKFTRSLYPLVTHKNNMGVSTRLVTLSEVYDRVSWQGRDNPEKIKYFIKTAIEEWGIKYVLLVGSFRYMPIRYVHNYYQWEYNNTIFYIESKFLSDLYFADIYDENGDFSSWDSNGNGVYGEWLVNKTADDTIDLYPDVYLGRIPCRNNFELRIVVKKIINYERTKCSDSWFKKIVVVGGDTYPAKAFDPNWTAYEGEEINQMVLENMSGFEPVKLWASDGTLTGPKDAIKAINMGCGFINFEGHATPVSWAAHPPNDESIFIQGLSTMNMKYLFNGKKLPICIVGGCNPLQFDTNFANIFKDPFSLYTWAPECWGWKLTRKWGGGSIATLGPTGLGMNKEDKVAFSGGNDFLTPSFFWEYNINGTDILGEVWGKTICHYLNKYPINWSEIASGDSSVDARTVQQWVLFGDPSLKIGGYS